jgi:hypothetical protein
VGVHTDISNSKGGHEKVNVEKNARQECMYSSLPWPEVYPFFTGQNLHNYRYENESG